MVDDTECHAGELIPSDDASWRYWIEVERGLALKPEFLLARIAVLGDPCHRESQRFASLSGDSYRKQVLARLQRAEVEA